MPLDAAKRGRKDCWGLLMWFGGLVKVELHLEMCIYSHEINAEKSQDSEVEYHIWSTCDEQTCNHFSMFSKHPHQ